MTFTKKNNKENHEESTKRVELLEKALHKCKEGSSQKEIARLESEIELLKKKLDESGEQGSGSIIQKLVIALKNAKEKMMEQQMRLKELTEKPSPFAIIIKTDNRPPKDEWKKGEPDEYVEGARVKIAPDSQYAHQNSGEGKIVKRRSDYVKVKFDDGYENSYGIGLSWNEDNKIDLLLWNGDEIFFSRYFATISFEGKLVEVVLPKEMYGKLEPGDTVKISPDTLQIIEKIKDCVNGEIALLTSVLGDMNCEVDLNGTRSVVFNGSFKEADLNKGDRVILDASHKIIIKNLGKDEKKFSLSEEIQVDWSDIGGLEEEKMQMREAIEFPFRQKELYTFFKKKPMKGVLLYGPPGCGKTLLAKAAATSLAKSVRTEKNEDISGGYIYIKGPEILTKWVGESESIIRQLFQRAREHKREKGYPAVIFIDEAEAIFRRRGSGISSDMESTIVPMFLAEMDGLEDTGALIILATNRADILDPAVVRDGRIDRKIRIGRPDKRSVEEIFNIHLKGIPLHNGFSHEELASFATRKLFSNKFDFYSLKTKEDANIPFSLKNIVNGGMIASIIDQATSFAMRKTIESELEPTGVAKEDLTNAINSVYRQNKDLGHDEAIKEFIEDQKTEVVGISRN